jgi:hypothetical protein
MTSSNATETRAFVLSENLSERVETVERIADIMRTVLPGKKVQVTVGQYRKSRSNQQNRALFGVAYKALSEATGNDPEDLHRYFKGEYGGWDVMDVMGQKCKVPKIRSSTMTTSEFSDFYQFIQRRSAQAGYNVPDPNEY